MSSQNRLPEVVPLPKKCHTNRVYFPENEFSKLEKHPPLRYLEGLLSPIPVEVRGIVDSLLSQPTHRSSLRTRMIS
jgi:hypothetical protein